MTRLHAIPAPRAPRRAGGPSSPPLALPRSIAPMLATLSLDLPDDAENWAFEHKWDGVRALCFWDGSQFRLHSRNQLDITPNYPELHDLADALGKRRRVVLDGEIIAPDPVTGLPDFPRLTRRMHVANPSDTLRRSVPICFMLFDVLYQRGRSVMALPFSERRAMLEELTLRGPFWAATPTVVGEGAAMLESVKRNRMEGVVAKRLDSAYLPGRRSPDWKKIKVVFGQEFVVGGWIPEAGERHGRIGSLLVGYYDCPTAGNVRPAFRYAGSIGTGYSDSTHAQLVGKLQRLTRSDSPFADPIPGKAGVQFVDPELIAEIQYRRWPVGGSLQQASFKGLRTDKRPEEVVREQ